MSKIKKKDKRSGKTAGKRRKKESTQQEPASSEESAGASAEHSAEFSNFASQEEERRKANKTEKKRKLRIIIAVSVFMVFIFFAAVMVYIFTAENTDIKFTYSQPGEVRVVQQTQTTQNPASAAGSAGQKAEQNYWRPMGQPVNLSAIEEKNAVKCSAWETFEEVCKADSGCQGTRPMSCVNGKWEYGNCTTAYSTCSDSMCRIDCRGEKQKYAEKYSLTDQSIIFFYMNEPHSNAMLPFMKTMSNVYLLENGKDIWFENYLGLQGTIPAVVCFSNNAVLIGERTQSEVEDFRLRNC